MASPAVALETETPILGEDAWASVMDLSCEMCAEVSIGRFKVADLLQLRKGFVVSTDWSKGKDIPVVVNGAQIGWSEIEVAGERLAIRLTDLT